METFIYSQDVAKSSDLESHIVKNLRWLDTIDNRNSFPRVRVWLSKNSSSLSRGTSQFVTKILVSLPRKDVFVESTSVGLVPSINRAAKKLKHSVFNKNKKGV